MTDQQGLPGTAPLDLPEFDAPPLDPLPLMHHWFATAERLGVAEHLAVAFATAGADGTPTNRMVLLKVLEPAAVVFTTTGGSRKGRDLAANPVGAISAYWRETRQQLRLSGPVERLGDAESDALFAVRPIASQASAIVSRQGESLDDPATLRADADRLAASTTPLPRPADWHGYRLTPDRIEFWHGTMDRLHRRLLYVRDGDGAGWSHTRLHP